MVLDNFKTVMKASSEIDKINKSVSEQKEQINKLSELLENAL